MTAGDRDYVKQLGDVLRRRDAGALRAFLIEQAARYGDDHQVAAVEQQSDDELTTLLHRMILARGDLADLHPASQRWLADNGALPPGAPGGSQRRRPRGGPPGGRPGGGRPGGASSGGGTSGGSGSVDQAGGAPGGSPPHARGPLPHRPPDGTTDLGRDGSGERGPSGPLDSPSG